MQSFDEVREQLTSRLAELERRHEKIESHLRQPGNPDWTERATESENDQVLEGLGAQEREEIALVRVALDRIDRGTYGTCAGCDEPIPLERLRVLPYATSCVSCAS